MKIKVFLILPIIALVLFASCKKDTSCDYKDSTVVAPATEVASLQDSLTKYGITASAHPSGFFYEITNPGSGAIVSNLCSNITVAYKGSFFNGETFDSTVAGTTAYFALGRVIVGWQKGIPLVKSGGSINLYIPPALAYGPESITDPNTGEVVIPGKSYLVFEVNVKDIQ